MAANPQLEKNSLNREKKTQVVVKSPKIFLGTYLIAQLKKKKYTEDKLFHARQADTGVQILNSTEHLQFSLESQESINYIFGPWYWTCACAVIKSELNSKANWNKRGVLKTEVYKGPGIIQIF